MTIYAKYLITTASALLFVAAPSNKEMPMEPQQTTHDVEKLIGITEKDIRELETKVDSILVSNGDSSLLKRLNNGTINTK